MLNITKINLFTKELKFKLSKQTQLNSSLKFTLKTNLNSKINKQS
ncbi:hypothetical protein [Campylobacter troglodytis]|nr:hypothetical protein [Campylobacter troglodytis]